MKLRKVIALLIGFFVSVVLAIILVQIFKTWHLLVLLGRRCLPPFFGGIFAGYIVQRRAWAFGLLVAAMLEAFGFVVSMCVFEWAEGMHNAFLHWASDWWLLLPVLVAGAGGGYLGELLYKIRRRQLKNF